MSDEGLGEALCKNWAPYRTCLFIERDTLRALGIENCDEIIQKQFEWESKVRAAGTDMREWDQSHTLRLKETLQAMHRIRDQLPPTHLPEGVAMA